MTDAMPLKDAIFSSQDGLSSQDNTSARVQAGDVFDEVSRAIARGDAKAVHDSLAPVHPAELASMLEQFNPEHRAFAIDALGDDFVPEILAELDPTVMEQVTGGMAIKKIAAALGALDSDDAVDVLGELKEDRQKKILRAMPDAHRVLIEDSLSFPQDSAGRLMQRETVCIPVDWNVGQIIDHMREGADLPQDFYDVFVVDEKHRLIGGVPLSRVLRTPRSVAVSRIVDRDVTAIPVLMDQEEIAFLFRRRNLVSVPVIDDGRRLVGVITIDDVVDIIDEEASEDIMRLGGISGERFYAAVIDTVRARFSWLAVNLVCAFVAATVIARFDYAIEGLVALAVLMPIVASTGGSAGTQSLTTAVRALAMRELTWSNAWRTVRKEASVAVLNGTLFAILAGIITWWWYEDARLAAVLSLAMIVTFLIAGLMGTLAPLILTRLGVDPAVASGTFVSITADVVGFFSFLALATWWLLS